MTSVTTRRIGILGGTFDPPHIGHLRVAVAVRHALGLDEIRLVPNGDPWQKRGQRRITPSGLRLQMVHLSIELLTPDSGVVVSDVEVRRAGPSYTIDTVAALQEGDDVEVTVVLGRDAAALLPTWERYQELLGRVVLAVVDRPGVDRRSLGPEVTAREVPIAIDALDVSSSGVRHLVAEGAPIDALVAPSVAALIHQEGLYRG